MNKTKEAAAAKAKEIKEVKAILSNSIDENYALKLNMTLDVLYDELAAIKEAAKEIEYLMPKSSDTKKVLIDKFNIIYPKLLDVELLTIKQLLKYFKDNKEAAIKEAAKAANRYKEGKAAAAAKSTKEAKATTKAANRYFILLGSSDNELNYTYNGIKQLIGSSSDNNLIKLKYISSDTYKIIHTTKEAAKAAKKNKLKKGKKMNNSTKSTKATKAAAAIKAKEIKAKAAAKAKATKAAAEIKAAKVKEAAIKAKEAAATKAAKVKEAAATKAKEVAFKAKAAAAAKEIKAAAATKAKEVKAAAKEAAKEAAAAAKEAAAAKVISDLKSKYKTYNAISDRIDENKATSKAATTENKSLIFIEMSKVNDSYKAAAIKYPLYNRVQLIALVKDEFKNIKNDTYFNIVIKIKSLNINLDLNQSIAAINFIILNIENKNISKATTKNKVKLAAKIKEIKAAAKEAAAAVTIKEAKEAKEAAAAAAKEAAKAKAAKAATKAAKAAAKAAKEAAATKAA